MVIKKKLESIGICSFLIVAASGWSVFWFVLHKLYLKGIPTILAGNVFGSRVKIFFLSSLISGRWSCKFAVSFTPSIKIQVPETFEQFLKKVFWTATFVRKKYRGLSCFALRGFDRFATFSRTFWFIFIPCLKDFTE